MPHVPDPVAIHGGTDGRPDGFGLAWLPVVLTVALGLGVPLLLALSSLPGLRRGDRGPTYRFMGAIAAVTSALMAVLMTWTLVVQTGLAAATDAPAAGGRRFWLSWARGWSAWAPGSPSRASRRCG